MCAAQLWGSSHAQKLSFSRGSEGGKKENLKGWGNPFFLEKSNTNMQKCKIMQLDVKIRLKQNFPGDRKMQKVQKMRRTFFHALRKITLLSTDSGKKGWACKNRKLGFVTFQNIINVSERFKIFLTKK